MINVDSNVHEGLLTARQAADRLGVRKETLYAYVSRGLLARYGGPRSRGSYYAKADIDRLVARRDARAGHAAVAAGALRWGEPVLDTELCFVGPRGPSYRGKYAVDLAAENAPFEVVAEWLWRGAWTLDAAWPHRPTKSVRFVRRDLPGRLMAAALAFERHEQRAPLVSEATELARARDLVRTLAGGHDGSIAEAVAMTLSVAPMRRRVAAINAALVLLADHELNASAFAARVAASTGAVLGDCIVAALATAAGPRHGTASRRVLAIAADVAEPRRARHALQQRLARGDDLPGFGHPLYPEGDPRARVLLEIASHLSPASKTSRVLAAMGSAVRAMGGPPPNVDLGLASLATALGSPDAGPLLFFVGRSAGWVAHVLEQRRAGFLLRPRARYIGPDSSSIARRA